MPVAAHPTVSDYLTKETAWFLGYATVGEAAAAASKMLEDEDGAELDAVLLWPATDDLAWRPERWAVLYVSELVWPNYSVVARPGYDPVPALSEKT